MIAAAAVALRLPTAASRAVLGYDDGTYLASILAMGQGGAPFRDVYSSQGPAFLPLLRLGDLLGLGSPVAARMVPVVAGAALVVITYRLALRVAPGAGALLTPVLVATSGSLLYSTSRIESDGIAAALGAGAVLAAARPGARRTVASVVLIGMAVGVKSLMAGPPLLAVLWLLGRRHGVRAAVAALAGAAGVVLLLALPWGLPEVWDQSVRLHLLAREGGVDLGDRLSYLRGRLWHRDRLIVAAGAVGLGAALAGRHRRRRGEGVDDVTAAIWLWMAGAVAIVVAHSPLFLQHLSVLVAPAALLVARARPPVGVVGAALVVLVPGHGAAAGWRLSQLHPSAAEEAMVDLLAGIEPAEADVIADEPALGWLAGRASPGSMVDPSYVRIDAGLLTTADVVDAAEEPGVCAVLLWSGRLDGLPDLRRSLVDYRAVVEDGPRVLLLRDGCRLSVRPGTARPRSW